MLFNEFTLDNLVSQPARVRVTILVGVFLLILALAYFLLIKPRLVQLELLEKKRINLDKIYQVKNATITTLPFYQEKLKSLQKIEETIQSQMTSAPEFSGLIGAITKLSENNGLRVTLFKPESEEKQAGYIVMPINLIVNGDYTHLALFLNQLLALNKIITVQELSLAPLTDATYLNMKLNLSTYRDSGEKIASASDAKLPDLSELTSSVHKIPLNPNPFALSLFTLNNPEEPLTAFTLASLKMVGTIEKQGEIWALVATTENRIFRVRIGMRMGELSGTVVEVNQQEIKIIQTLQNGAKREVSLKMSEDEITEPRPSENGKTKAN